MDLEDAIPPEAKTGIDDDDVFRRDDGKGLYFYEQAAGRALLQVVFFEVKRYEAFGFIDGEGPF